jgi:hypothetical protein
MRMGRARRARDRSGSDLALSISLLRDGIAAVID